ncbi:MAG: hypothetical protein E7464_00055 [Ruminococcaceae bacterium]|nr:hypothetical protein [Oscillospiraceae bacterium]
MLHVCTVTQAQQPDYIALAIVGVLLLGVVAAVLRKYFAKKKAHAMPAEAATDQGTKAAATAAAPGCAGELKLHDVPPKTAAMVMAIVADTIGKPLNELRFISIKEVTKK